MTAMLPTTLFAANADRIIQLLLVFGCRIPPD
jgi:hypothetical protein